MGLDYSKPSEAAEFIEAILYGPALTWVDIVNFPLPWIKWTPLTAAGDAEPHPEAPKAIATVFLKNVAKTGKHLILAPASFGDSISQYRAELFKSLGPVDDDTRAILKSFYLNSFSREAANEAMGQSRVFQIVEALLERLKAAMDDSLRSRYSKVNARMEALVRFGRSQHAYSDLGLMADEPTHYIGSIVEMKRFSRLSDLVMNELLASADKGEKFKVEFSPRIGKLAFIRVDDSATGTASTTVQKDSPLHNALHFLVEAAAYSWAGRTRFGVITNCIASVAVELAAGDTRDSTIMLRYSRPTGNTVSGSLLPPPQQSVPRPEAMNQALDEMDMMDSEADSMEIQENSAAAVEATSLFDLLACSSYGDLADLDGARPDPTLLPNPTSSDPPAPPYNLRQRSN